MSSVIILLSTLRVNRTYFEKYICIFSYMANIRDASDEEKGGGYDASLACHRALMDAFSGLFLYQNPNEVPT